MAESGFVLAPPLQRQSRRANQITKETQGGSAIIMMTMAMVILIDIPVYFKYSGTFIPVHCH